MNTRNYVPNDDDDDDDDGEEEEVRWGGDFFVSGTTSMEREGSCLH